MMRCMRGRIRSVAAIAALMLVAAAFQPAAAAQLPRRAPVPGSSCRVFPADNVWSMDVSKLPVAKKSKMWKTSMHAGSTLLHPDFGPPAYGMPFDVVDDSHQKVHVDFGYADESDPGPYPFGPDTHIEGGSDRHATDDRSRHLHALRAVRRGLERRADGRQRRDLHARRRERERPAARDVDVGRRGRTADLPRPRTVGRGERRRDRSRDPVHGRLHEPAIPLAGASSGGEQRRPVPADGRAVPPEGGVRRVAVQRRREGRSSRR